MRPPPGRTHSRRRVPADLVVQHASWLAMQTTDSCPTDTTTTGEHRARQTTGHRPLPHHLYLGDYTALHYRLQATHCCPTTTLPIPTPLPSVTNSPTTTLVPWSPPVFTDIELERAPNMPLPSTYPCMLTAILRRCPRSPSDAAGVVVSTSSCGPRPFHLPAAAPRSLSGKQPCRYSLHSVVLPCSRGYEAGEM